MTRPTPFRERVEARCHRLAEKLLDLDAKWHARHDQLERQGVNQYHIDNDVILRNLSGATKIVSDMLAAMSAYLTATRPRVTRTQLPPPPAGRPRA